MKVLISGAGIGGREQRDLDPGGDQALGEQRHDALPRPIVPWRHAPGDGGQHANAQRAIEAWMSGERVHARIVADGARLGCTL